MSVPFIAGNFKSEQDKQDKLRYYENMLRFRARLNLANEKYSAIIQDQADEGTPSAPMPLVSVEERLADTNFQRQSAITNLKVILSANDATGFVNAYLTSLEELVLFNRRFNDFFKRKLENVKMVTPLYLNQQWDDYKAGLLPLPEGQDQKPQTTTSSWTSYKDDIFQAIMSSPTYDDYRREIMTVAGISGNKPNLWLKNFYKNVSGQPVPKNISAQSLFTETKNMLMQSSP